MHLLCLYGTYACTAHAHQELMWALNIGTHQVLMRALHMRIRNLCGHLCRYEFFYGELLAAGSHG